MEHAKYSYDMCTHFGSIIGKLTHKKKPVYRMSIISRDNDIPE